MHACMHVCVYVCMYVCMYVFMYVCAFVRVCLYVCMCISRVHKHIFLHEYPLLLQPQYFHPALSYKTVEHHAHTTQLVGQPSLWHTVPLAGGVHTDPFIIEASKHPHYLGGTVNSRSIIFRKILKDKNMLIRTRPGNLQMSCKSIFTTQVIIKSILDPEDNETRYF